MTDKQIKDRVNVKECKYYCNGKCERYEEFVEADYADYTIKCICENENDLFTYDICDYQQLQAKEQEFERLSSLIRKTQTYKDTCCDCKDDILLYPSISGRTNYTQIEVEEMSLKRIIEQLDQLKASLDEKNKFLEQLGISATGEFKRIKYYVDKLVKENEELKKEVHKLNSTIDFIKVTEHSAINKYKNLKQTLDEIKEIVQFGDRPYKLCGEYNDCCDVLNKIWNKISEIDDESYLDNHWLFTENKKGEN